MYTQFTFYTPKGEKLITTKNIISATWARTLNKVGTCEVVISPKSFDFEIYKQKDLGLLIEIALSKYSELTPDMSTFWFLRNFKEAIENKTPQFILTFSDALTLLDQRIVAFRANSPEGSEKRTSLNGAGNVEMKRVIDENIGAIAPQNKSWYPSIVTRPITRPSPTIEKDIAWKSILSILQQICNTSTDKGIPLFFDLELNQKDLSLEFVTYLNQRGYNKTNEVLSSTHRDFVLLNFEINHDLPNTAYVGGAGKGADRLVGFAQNSVVNSSKFGLHEVFTSLNDSNQESLNDEARNLVNNVTGQITLEGKLLGDLSNKYNLGDRLLIEHRGFLIECTINSIKNSIQNNVFTRDIIIKSL